MTLRELVQRRISELQKPILDAVLSGAASLPEYHRLIGKYEGMQLALREIDGLLDDEFDDDPPL